VCDLTLVSSPHLARSYHHLFPVEPYEELSQEQLDALTVKQQPRRGRARAAVLDDDDDDGHDGEHRGAAPVALPPAPWREVAATGLYCFGCLRPLGLPGEGVGDGEEAGLVLVLRCPLCLQLFCFGCDAFVHESLHNCPGCECAAAAGVQEVRQSNSNRQ